MSERINSYEALMKLKPPQGQGFAVYTYVLNEDLIPKSEEKRSKETNKSEGNEGREVPSETKEIDLSEVKKEPINYGLLIQLGVYPTINEAQKRVNEIISITGHETIFCAKLGMFTELSPKPINRTVITLSEGVTQSLKEIRREELEKEKKRKEIAEEMEKERQDEQDPTNLEYLRLNLYMAIRAHSSIKSYKSKMEELKISYKERIGNIKEFISKIPEGLENFLPMIKAKLERRGEISLFESISSGFKELMEKEGL